MEESINGLFKINGLTEGNKAEKKLSADMYSPLALAYIGDSIFDAMIKMHFISNANMQVEKYHKKVTAIVKAKNQAEVIDNILEDLSEDELAVYKRGRNATTHSKAKNATMSEYRKATGFEALIGYLYLEENSKRLDEILQIVLKLAGEK